MTIRPYTPSDYEQVAELYRHSEYYGGQFDDNRDSEERLRKRTELEPESVFVAEKDGKILGTVSTIDDGRVAWLFRFAVRHDEHEYEITKKLCFAAIEALKKRGHDQVLVYAPVGNTDFEERYADLGFAKGGDYTCNWKDI